MKQLKQLTNMVIMNGSLVMNHISIDENGKPMYNIS